MGNKSQSQPESRRFPGTSNGKSKEIEVIKGEARSNVVLEVRVDWEDVGESENACPSIALY
jgi:hypothetical protein